MQQTHVGQLIKQELERQGRTASWLARQINCTRTNIHKIFLRQSIDTEQLARISLALRHNFLAQLAADVQKMQVIKKDEWAI